MALPPNYKGRPIVDEGSAIRDGYAPLTSPYLKGELAMLDKVIADMETARAVFCLVNADGGICVYRKGMRRGTEIPE